MYNSENKMWRNDLMSMCNFNNKMQQIAKCEVTQIITSGKWSLLRILGEKMSNDGWYLSNIYLQFLRIFFGKAF